MKSFTLQIKNVPRFYVFLTDLVLIALSFSLSYFVVKQFMFPDILRGHFFVYTFTYTCISALIFYFMHIYAGVVRFSTMNDMFRICSAILLSSVAYVLADELIIFQLLEIDSLNTFKILLINFFISFSALILLRVAVRGAYHAFTMPATEHCERVVIYGAGREALVIKQAIESSDDARLSVVGFMSDAPQDKGLYIQQKRVYTRKQLLHLRAKNKVDKLVLANDALSELERREVITRCLEAGIKILTVPPSNQWVYGRLKLKQIQDLKIEDLLQRDPILISDVHIFNELSGKKILITGAAGSIGSEIVRQVAKYRPDTIILCDQAESPLHDMQMEMQDKYPGKNIVTFIGSVRRYERMRTMFDLHRPEVVFHAAAYKHVPMMENYPTEAILTNVEGTKNIADLSVQYNVKKFVMISTDKAVNPTNIMGASKRIAEMYIQSLNAKTGPGGTRFMTTRFGNVLDSNGSVIPRFRSQIQNGGPVTVTHPDIVRYFMTIPEAVQLVLEAGTMGQGGEIFVFDMGSPIRIADLAKNMIRLAGLTVDKDIKIVYTGLRPGEKLYEELLNDKELVKPTHHEKIKIARVVQYDADFVRREVKELISLTDYEDGKAIAKKMKEIVPEFKSQNSVFEKLDISDSVDELYTQNRN